MPARRSRSARRLLVAVRRGSVAACSPARRRRAVVVAGARCRSKLTVGLGYIPSVQFARVLSGRPGRLLRRRGSRVTFQNAIDADLVPKVGAGHARSRPVRRHERDPGRQPGRADHVRRDDLRQVPVDRVRQGEQRDHRRRRPRRQEARDPGQVRLVVDHAPGAARVEGPHAGRPDDRRVPGLRPGRRRGSGRRRRGHRVRQQRAGPARPDGREGHGPADRRRHAAARPRDHRRDGDAQLRSATR